MIQINIPFNDPAITWQFARSSGPGGQNVNKTESKAVLYFDIHKTKNLNTEQKRILYNGHDNPSLNHLQNRTSAAGKIIITNQESSSRETNRQTALQTLNKLLTEALDIPEERKIGLTKKAKSSHYGNIKNQQFLKYKRTKENLE